MVSSISNDDHSSNEQHDDHPSPPVIPSPVALGFVPPPGTEYTQPRKPFAKTSWSPALNAFVYADGCGAKGGHPPTGYVRDPTINGLRRTREQTELDEARLKARVESARSGPETFFGENCVNGVMLELSGYVGAMGHHAPLIWWKYLITTLTALCVGDNTAAAMSKERGDRKRLLHYQFIARIITTEFNLEKVRTFIRQGLHILPNSGTRCKISVRPFGGSQTWAYMLGYVQKDRDRAKNSRRRISLSNSKSSSSKPSIPLSGNLSLPLPFDMF